VRIARLIGFLVMQAVLCLAALPGLAQ